VSILHYVLSEHGLNTAESEWQKHYLPPSGEA
jgi:hypothetical protein